MIADVYSQENKKVGTHELPDKIFNAKWNANLVHQVLTSELSTSRNSVAHTKNRGEVRGGGKKPWRQKHTGRARHGSTRSPLWIGGGVTFGPRNEKNFTRKVNKKMKKAALYAVLSDKLKGNEIKIFENLKLKESKTKNVSRIIRNFFDKKKSSILFVPDSENKNMVLAARNIEKSKVLNPKSLNVHDLLKYKYIFMEKNAVQEIR